MRNYYKGGSRDTVELYPVVSMPELKRQGFLSHRRRNFFNAPKKSNDLLCNPEIDISLYLPSASDKSRIVITFRYLGLQKREVDKRQEIDLQATRCHFGDGYRWWFICPMEWPVGACRRRVATLFFKQGFLACRYCLNLTYQSVLDRHKWYSLAKKEGVHPKRMAEMMKGGSRSWLGRIDSCSHDKQ